MYGRGKANFIDQPVDQARQRNDMPDFFDNGFPVLTSDMLEPANAPILTVVAKKLYRDWMLTIGMHDKGKIADGVRELSEALKAYEEDLRGEVNLALEEVSVAREKTATPRHKIAEQRNVIFAAKKAAEDPAEKSGIAANEVCAAEAKLKEMQSATSPELQEALIALENAKAKSRAFRQDKGKFLVEYINSEVQKANPLPHIKNANRRKIRDSSTTSKNAAKTGRKENTPRSRPARILVSFVGVAAAVWLITKLINLPDSTTTTQPVTTERAAQATLEAKASFRQYLGWSVSQPGVKPGRYVKALEKISFEGSTMFLSLSLREYDEAVKLCNLVLRDWPARKEHGITRVKVVLSSSRYSILAESTRKASGEEVCR
jgi:hypothetical protein